MTERDEFLLEKKTETYAWLNAHTPSQKLLDVYSVDTRIRTYTQDVIDHPETHCLYEAAAVKRFMLHLDRPNVYFDTQAYTRIVRTHENTPQDSESGRRKFAVTPPQSFIYASIFGLTLDDSSRLYQTAVVCCSRKFGKTSLTGIVGIHEMLYGPHNAQVILAANSEKQGKQCFAIFKGQIDSLDPDGQAFKTGKALIEWNKQHPRATDATAFAVANNASTLDGLHASLVIIDEWSQATSTDTRQVLTTSMKGRKNPLTLIVTTLSEVLNGPFYTELENYTDILTDKKADTLEHPTFVLYCTPDPGDEPRSENTWKKTQPHYGITVSRQDFEHDLAEADMLGGQALVAFNTKMLNTWCTENGTEWISYKKMQAATNKFSLEDIATTQGLQTAISVDLSESNDFTSIGVLAYSSLSGRHYFYNEYYFPKGRLETHPNSSLYKRWSDSGHLQLIDGDFIDQSFIAERIMEIAKLINPVAIYYDAWHSAETRNVLNNYGYTDILKCCKQTNANTHVLIQYLQKVILTKQASFSGNPLDAFCFSNVVILSDKHHNQIMDKRGANNSSTNPNKIDGAITSMMCCQAIFDGLITP